jgi:hypothetical protein
VADLAFPLITTVIQIRIFCSVKPTATLRNVVAALTDQLPILVVNYRANLSGKTS